MAKLSLKFRLVYVLALLCTALVCTFSFGGKPSAAAVQVAGTEYVSTYNADCITPQSTFTLGETVCVQAGNFPHALTTRFRRFQWSAPNSSIADFTTVKADPQYDKYIIPTSGDFAQVGTWRVTLIDASGEGFGYAKFIVRDPWYQIADLWLTKLAPDYVLPGQKVMLTLQVGNPGPDYAEVVEFVSEVPSDMIFSALRQVSGPYFSCRTPPSGGTGRTVCQTKYMKEGETAEFRFYYQVNPEAREGTVCSGGSSVSSYYTEEGNKSDNFWTTEVKVASPYQDECTDCGPVEEP